jgi:ATP-binding cassette subfamily C protein
MTHDPGIAFKTMTIDTALRLLKVVRGQGPGAPVESIEEAAKAAGLRARRVLLETGWWKTEGGPMLARIADRRGAARAGDAAPEATGWVAIVPRFFRGYTLVAVAPDGGTLTWQVDDAIAARLVPFAHGLHRAFPERAVRARDLLRIGLGRDPRDTAIVLALGLLAALIGLLTPIATGRLIDRAIPAGATTTIGQIIFGLAVAGLAVVAMDMVRSIAALRFDGKAAVATQAAILDRIVSAPSRFFRAFTSGDLAQRLNGIHTVQRTMTASIVGVVIASLFVVANLALMLWYSAALAAVSMAVVAAAVALSIAIGLVRVRLGRRIEALDGRIGALSFEYLSGIAKLRASAAEPRAYANWSRLYGDRQRVSTTSATWANFETVVLSFLQPAATVLVLFLAWRLATSSEGVAARGAISTGTFIAFQAALFALLAGVQSIVGIGLGLLHLKPLWERARPILEVLPEDHRGRGTSLRHNPRGAIALKNVGFAYPGGPEVLKGIDLDIRAGEYLAVVGPSGSGKSTLVRLLLGFEAPDRGSVLYDGTDLETLDLSYLRRHIGTVLQGGKLWAGDLYTNIVGAAHLPVEAAWDAARAAGLAEDIEAMPMGMYTLVSEGMSTLSGGQRQRVLIARALVSAPRVLLLDEATSALDNLSQARVLEGLSRLDATRLVIAHRLSSVRDADRIVVLDRGRIVQEGTFPELAASPGLFQAMLARQT